MGPMDRISLLIPVIFPQDEPLTDANVQALTGFNIVLLGYWQTPDGVDPAVVREEHAVDAQAVLYELAAQFSRAGARTDVQLHFGPEGEYMDALQTRIVEETDADAVVTPGRITHWNNVIVPLRDDRNADRVVEFLAAFDPETLFVLELFHATDDDSRTETAREMLAEIKRGLLDRGFSENDIEVTVEVTADPEEAIIDRASSHNVVVIGETEEISDTGRFFGPVYDRLVEHTDVPVVVVRG